MVERESAEELHVDVGHAFTLLLPVVVSRVEVMGKGLRLGGALAPSSAVGLSELGTGGAEQVFHRREVDREPGDHFAGVGVGTLTEEGDI